MYSICVLYIIRNFNLIIIILSNKLLFTGYAGIACESCAAGWVRNSHGDCEPCTCDTRGALTQTCDAHARCHCRTHVVGDKCDRCDLTRHFLDEGGCRRK